MSLWLHKSLICSIISVNNNNKTLIMQPHDQFARILEIYKSFSQKIFNSSGNLHHCGRAPLCSDVEFIAIEFSLITL